MIEDYIQNIVSKIWIGQKTQSFTMVTSEIKDIFIHFSFPEKEVFIGKTENFYFILDGINESGFLYGILFLNTDLRQLILGFERSSS